MRASGVLMAVSSLPSEYGIGCFSREAYEFVDQLEKAGQQYWQILPLGPTGYGDSPYQSCSTFAGNPYFIDLDELVREGLLTKEECTSCSWGDDPGYVDYEKIYNSRHFQFFISFFHINVPFVCFFIFLHLCFPLQILKLPCICQRCTVQHFVSCASSSDSFSSADCSSVSDTGSSFFRRP
jgi:hypothetical protein